MAGRGRAERRDSPDGRLVPEAGLAVGPPGGGADAPNRPTGPLPAEYLLGGYLALSGLLALGSFTRAGLALAGLHALAVALLLRWTPGPLPRRRPLRILRLILPVLVAPLLYKELETLNQLVNPGYLDALVQRWEEAIFGVQLSVAAAERMPSLWLSELLHGGYASYYFVLPAAGAAVYLEAGPDETDRTRALARLVTAVALAFYLCYLCFAVFPVAGPRYEFARIAGPPSDGPIFAAVHAILEAGSSKGTAFPSSHVAATVAGVLAVRWTSRRWFLVLCVPAVLLTLGTVYGRFHYGVDALAGLAVALLAWWATGRIPGHPAVRPSPASPAD